MKATDRMLQDIHEFMKTAERMLQDIHEDCRQNVVGYS